MKIKPIGKKRLWKPREVTEDEKNQRELFKKMTEAEIKQWIKDHREDLINPVIGEYSVEE